MGEMRDTIIGRRALLALAAGFGMAGWPIRLIGSQPAGSQPAGARLAGRHKPHPPRPARPRRAVALDPGHGGSDPGAISPGGLYEKDITLSAARELARQLEMTGRYHIVLTRHGDTFLPLRERVARARAHHAELLLSLHADALPNTAMRGLSVYTLSDDASDRETAALAIRENKDDFVAGINLSRQPAEIGTILLDLARRQTNNRSLALARAILQELGHDVPLLERPQRAADFAVLTAPDMPSVLAELGCLSNPDDERLLPQRAFQQLLAQGFRRAIEDYFAARITA
jgi:N-acetylmuramoyl-L-alanine amidase